MRERERDALIDRLFKASADDVRKFMVTGSAHESAVTSYCREFRSFHEAAVDKGMKIARSFSPAVQNYGGCNDVLHTPLDTG